jgi:hypothetical protein
MVAVIGPITDSTIGTIMGIKNDGRNDNNRVINEPPPSSLPKKI